MMDYNHHENSIEENSTHLLPMPDINLPMFEDMEKQELELTKSLQLVRFILVQKKDLLSKRLIEARELAQEKNLMQQKVVVTKEEIILENKKYKQLEMEVKELLVKEAELKSDIQQVKHKLSDLEINVGRNESKMNEYSTGIQTMDANSKLGEQFLAERKKTEDIKDKIAKMQNSIEEFNKVHNKNKLQRKLQQLRQEKYRLQAMLAEKNKSVISESEIYTRKLQEKDVMWKCHQAKKRRLRSEILRMTQVREQQQYEANRLKECIKNFQS